MSNSTLIKRLIKQIYLLHFDENVKVTCALLSKRLKCSNIETTKLLKLLARKGLLNYQKYQAISLTESGLALATNQVRKHQLWEFFLNKKLNFNLEAGFSQSELLALSTSDELMNRLDAFLDFPTFSDKALPKSSDIVETPLFQKVVRLSNCKLNDTGIIARLEIGTPTSSVFYDRHSLAVGAKITIVSIDSAKKSLIVENNGNTFYVGNKQAKQIYLQID